MDSSRPPPIPRSTLGRIIRLTEEVIKYREWIIKKWGGRDLTRPDHRDRGSARSQDATALLSSTS